MCIRDRKNADPRSGLFSYAYALRWQGKWNEAAKLMRALEDDADPQGQFLYHNLLAYCAWDKRDLKGLTAEVKALKELPAEGLSKDAASHIAEHVALRDMLSKELNGKPSKAAAGYLQVADDPKALPAHRVLFSLKAAGCLADPAERHARLAYVAEHGGTTWCMAEARKRLEKEDVYKRQTQAYAEDGIVQQAVALAKERQPALTVITDVCLCEYTDHGHCGLVDGERVLNDESVALLAATAVSHARAGADIVAPSDMMDGRVGAIRDALDENGFEHVAVMSYAAKFASAFYGPFREAADSAPQFGDRKSYQMDPANGDEALREVMLDVEDVYKRQARPRAPRR